MQDFDLDGMAEAWGGRPKKEKPRFNLAWKPPLNPEQQKAYDSKAKFILTDGERASGKCVHHETIAYVNGGLSRMIRLKPKAGDEMKARFVSFNGEALTESDSDSFYSEPNPEAYRLTCNNGSKLECSPRHPVWAHCVGDGGEPKFGYLTSSELAAKLSSGVDVYVPVFGHPSFEKVDVQTVAITLKRKDCSICGKRTIARGLCANHYAKASRHKLLENYTAEYVEHVSVTPGIAYLLGALCGDGSVGRLNRGGQVGFSNIDRECLDMVKAALLEIGGELKNNPSQSACDWSIVGCLKLRELLRETGSAVGSLKKRIPDVIIESPKPVLASFLRGLYDTDGTVEKTGSVVYCSASDGLASDVQVCLQALGVFSVKKFKPNKCAGAWMVYCFGEDSRRFFDAVGFHISRKANRRSKTPPQVNRNFYGYPPSVIKTMREVKAAIFHGRKATAWKPIVAKKRIGKRRIWWEVSGHIDLKFFYKSFRGGLEAEAFAATKEAERARLSSYSREWHDKHRSTLQCKYIPSPDKLSRFVGLMGTSETLEKFRLSGRWVKVISAEKTTAPLCDVCVPGTHSFLANGLINHNTVGGLHKLVNHAFENWNALCIIIVGVKRQAEAGGAWHKLLTEVLPQWRLGRGIENSEPKSTLAKDMYVWVTNKHGSDSMVMLLSMPVEGHVADRIKGVEGSFWLVDEAQTLESDVYFAAIVQQLGRRPKIKLQQIVYAANPEGPSHWLYKRFFVKPVNTETGEWDQQYARFHIPFEENKHNVDPEYYRNVMEATRHDEVEADRMLRGIWRDRATGTSIFKDVFNASIHVLGDYLHGRGIVPFKGWPVSVGYDLGAAHSSVTFLQWVTIKLLGGTIKNLWLAFDELNYVGQYLPYTLLVPKILARMAYWDDRVGVPLTYEHISDNSAFNQYRAASGSFDAWDIEKISDNKIRLIACPKGSGSVPARYRMIHNLLRAEEFLISATCPRLVEIIRCIESPKPNEAKGHNPDLAFTPREGSPLEHGFDSASYPVFYHWTRMLPSGRVKTADTSPNVFHLGKAA